MDRIKLSLPDLDLVFIILNILSIHVN